MPADPDMRVGVFLRTSLHPRTLPRAPISATVTRNNETVTHMPHQPPHNAHRETGSVTAEFAVLLPAVVLLILIVLAAALISRADISVHTAARTTARAVSVGLDPPATPTPPPTSPATAGGSPSTHNATSPSLASRFPH